MSGHLTYKFDILHAMASLGNSSLRILEIVASMEVELEKMWGKSRSKMGNPQSCASLPHSVGIMDDQYQYLVSAYIRSQAD